MGRSATIRGLLGSIAALTVGCAAWAADPAVSAKIDPTEIELGQSASLTVTASGADPTSFRTPSVPGLEFAPVAQSRSVQSVNGVTTSSVSVTYRITAQQAGTYVIASIAPGVETLTLKVDAAGSSVAGASSGSTAGQSPAHATGDPAFVRLVAPKHDLYVGQSLPVEIQVGTRDGVVVSLNGVPTLNGDAFTLDKLTAEPGERNQEIIDGKPFTVFTWHAILGAVKPGSLSLTLQTPMTVRVPLQRSPGQFPDSMLNGMLSDPAFQGFFGASTQRDVTVSSPAASFTVLELPADKPPDFSGAIGDFKVNGELSDQKVTVGDPVTVRLKIAGEGNFDRVKSALFTQLEGWKTYPATSKFTSAGESRYRGEKIFEQPLVATTPGRRVLPALTFSFFNPTTRRYETARSEPLSIDVAALAGAAAAGAAAAPLAPLAGAAPAPVSTPTAAPPAVGADPSAAGLRADHALERGAGNSRVPRYFQPPFMALPAFLLIAWSGAWYWLRRREARPDSGEPRVPRPEPGRLMAAMDRASAAGDEAAFFQAARDGLQQVLALRWQRTAQSVTLAEVEARLGADHEVRRLFALADEAHYSGRRFSRVELEHWKAVVLHEMQAPAKRRPRAEREVETT